MRSFRFTITAISALIAGVASVAFVGLAWADHHELPRNTAPDGASVYIISPDDGATVSSPVTVLFGLRGMGVGPAGLNNPKTGHHHLIIDSPLPNLDTPIPTDDKHRHFGGGQTETTIELSPGSHTLQLVLGDLNHVPHTNALTSQQITITVK